jgi:hypothetical protein
MSIWVHIGIHYTVHFNILDNNSRLAAENKMLVIILP